MGKEHRSRLGKMQVGACTEASGREGGTEGMARSIWNGVVSFGMVSIPVKPFALLMKALQKKKLTAVAKLAIRNKERLCALRPYDGTMMVETLFYPDEVRVSKGSELADVKISEKELQMAASLIDLMYEK